MFKIVEPLRVPGITPEPNPVSASSPAALATPVSAPQPSAEEPLTVPIYWVVIVCAVVFGGIWSGFAFREKIKYLVLRQYRKIN